MTDITQLVPSKTAAATPQQSPARGIVLAAPANLATPTIRVVLPSHTTDYDHQCRWTRQGDSLPTPGADCLVVFDETGAGIVAWWAVAPTPSRFVGEIATTALSTPAPGWLTGDGSAVTTAHPALRALLIADGSPYGVSGSDPLLPDLRGKVGMGVSGSHALGATGGEETHVLTTPEMPAHTHGINDASSTFGTAGSSEFFSGNSTAHHLSSSTGGGAAHNNLQPYVAVHYVIYAGL